MENIKQKIRACLELAKNDGATEAEAAAAMAMASKLMMKYNISQAEFKKIEVEVARSAAVAAETRWKVRAAQAAGRLYSAKLIRNAFTETVEFVGREENRDAAIMTYHYLTEQIERLYKVNLPKGLSKSVRAEYRRTFKDACALRVYQRASEIIMDMEASDVKALEATGSRALVVVQQRKTLEAEVDAFMSTMALRRGRATRVKGGIGTSSGFAAGEKVQLNRQVK